MLPWKRKKVVNLTEELLKDNRLIYQNAIEKEDDSVQEKCKKISKILNNDNLSIDQLEQANNVLSIIKEILNGSNTTVFQALNEVEKILSDKQYQVNPKLAAVFANEKTSIKNQNEIFYWEKELKKLNDKMEEAIKKGNKTEYNTALNKKTSIINRLKTFYNIDAKISKKTSTIESSIDIEHVSLITEELDNQVVDLKILEDQVTKTSLIDQDIVADSEQVNKLIDENIVDFNSLETDSFETARAKYLMEQKEISGENSEKEHTNKENEEIKQ